ncbi:SAM-dependent methyltransferase [Amycolatopsis sp. NPDC059027]|uniref:SAM-dependent methyltransferase n=1 Tax=Amycolatopsis sp. NPDC059027 TaxID=3346709 RepID=UPI003670BBFA
MTMTGDQAVGGYTGPTPEEVGATYDEFGDLYALTVGDVGVHVGMWSRPGEREPAATLGDLANRAQERQTAYHVETLALRADEHLLDIGCGTGLPAVRMARHRGGRVTGITVSATHLAKATETARTWGVSERVTFRHGNVMDLGFEDESFDAAMAVDVFAHLSDRQRAFREIARVLRPGSHFLLNDFTLRGTPPEEQLAAYLRAWCCAPPVTLVRTLEMAADAGLELVKAESMTPSCAFSGELMALLYADKHDAIAERYGPELTARMDGLVPLMRSLFRDHLGYYLYLLRKPGRR